MMWLLGGLPVVLEAMYLYLLYMAMCIVGEFDNWMSVSVYLERKLCYSCG